MLEGSVDAIVPTQQMLCVKLTIERHGRHIKSHLKFFEGFDSTLQTEADILPRAGKKVKSAYGPMWPTRPELIPVSVA